MNPLRAPGMIALTAVVAVLCLLLSACGDDGGPTNTVSVSGNPSQDADASQNLRDLSTKWGEATTKITYTLSSASGPLTSEAEVTVYRRPPDSRIDHTGSAGTNTVIVKPDLGYSCLDTSDSCALLTVEQAVASAEFIPFVQSLANDAGRDAIIGGSSTMAFQPERTIAGEQTKCIKAGGDLGGIAGEATFCFTEDGLLLAIDFAGGAQTFELTATGIAQPGETDLDPPLPVVTVPPPST